MSEKEILTEEKELTAKEKQAAESKAQAKKSSRALLFAFICILAVVIILVLLAWDPFGLKVDVSDGNGGSATVSNFDYSRGIGKDGYWEGIKASDIVTVPADYNNMKILLGDVEPSEEDVQYEVDEILTSMASTVDVTGAVENGDTLILDFAGKIDGVAFDGGTAEQQTLTLGTGGMIPGFEEAIIGHSVGETFDILVTFPSDYGVEGTDRGKLNGQPAVFTITIHSATRQVVPALEDDEVIENLKTNYGWDSIDAMYADIEEGLKQQNINDYVDQYLIANSVAVNIPESMIEYQKDANANYYSSMASYYGMDLETYLNYFLGCSTMDEVNEMYASVYSDAAKYFLVCQAIAEKEGLKVTEADVKSYFEKSMGSNDYSDYEDFYGKPYIMCITLDTMIIDRIIENATIQ